MAMFKGARNFDIHGGSFQAQWHEHHHQAPAVHSARDAFERLQQACAFGASYDSAERFPPPKCHPDTRKAVVKIIHDWIKHPVKSAQILWLYGPAGAGKSALAQTIAEECKDKGALASSFFFSRTSQDRNSEKPLVATLAYQLAVSIPILKPFILKVLEHDPSILNKSLEVQVAELLIKPIIEAKRVHRWKIWLTRRFGFGKQWPSVLIIDGLDECDNRQSQRQILRTIADAQVAETLPFYFLITSRPESDIRDTFEEPRIRCICRRVILDDIDQAREDIRTYLRSGFSDIQKKHHHIWPIVSDLTEPWPSDEVIDQLVFKSSGQFIYASTVLKFIDDRRHHPIERLDMILGMTSPGMECPFAELDLLYTQILKSVADVHRTMFVIGMLLILRGSLAVPFVETFLCLNPGELGMLLVDVHSLLYIPDPRDILSNSQAISFYHASFSDFLVDRYRSEEFFVDVAEMHVSAMRLCLHVVDNVEENLSIMPMGVADEYACTHWHIHLMSCTLRREALQLLQLFDIVHWAECITGFYSTNLKQIDMLQDVLDWVQSKVIDFSSNNAMTIKSTVSNALDQILTNLLKERLTLLQTDNLEAFISSELLESRALQSFIAEPQRIAGFFKNWDVGQWVKNSYFMVSGSSGGVHGLKRLDVLPRIIGWLSQTCHLREEEMMCIRDNFYTALHRTFKYILCEKPSDLTLLLGTLRNEYIDDFYVIRELFPDHVMISSTAGYSHFEFSYRNATKLLTFREFVANPCHSGQYNISPEVHEMISRRFLMILSAPREKHNTILLSTRLALEYAERNCAFHLHNALLSKELKSLAREFTFTHPEKRLSAVISHWLSVQESARPVTDPSMSLPLKTQYDSGT